MSRFWLLFLPALLMLGCQSSQELTLSNAAFLKHFSSETGPGGGGSLASNITTNITTNIVTDVTGIIATNVTTTISTNSATADVKVITTGVQLTIVVSEDRQLTRQVVVPPNGIIEFPPVGVFLVRGMTVERFTQKLKEVLEKDYLQTATVSVLAEAAPRGPLGGPGIIWVMGSVNHPGPLALPKGGRLTVFQAVLAAGGGGAFGNLSNVQLIRFDPQGKRCRTFVNVAHMLKTADVRKDIPLQDGDWLIVPEKIFSW